MTNAVLYVQDLFEESFKPFGTFAPSPPPSEPMVNTEFIKFWPESGGVVQLGEDRTTFATEVALGICQVRQRPFLIDVAECHVHSGEGILPLDGDILIHLAAPTEDEKPPKPEDFKVFYVPKHTQVVLKPGVWHHAPFSVNGGPVNVQIILPPKTYKIDCEVVKINPPIQFSWRQ